MVSIIQVYQIKTYIMLLETNINSMTINPMRRNYQQACLQKFLILQGLDSFIIVRKVMRKYSKIRILLNNDWILRCSSDIF